MLATLDDILTDSWRLRDPRSLAIVAAAALTVVVLALNWRGWCQFCAGNMSRTADQSEFLDARLIRPLAGEPGDGEEDHRTNEVR